MPENDLKILARYVDHAWSFIDHWPTSWCEVSPETTMVLLSGSEIDYLLDFSSGAGASLVRSTLIDRVNSAMEGSPRFVRLNSRSPKDAAGSGVPIVDSGEQAVDLLRASRLRCIPDLAALKAAGLAAQICLREVIPAVEDNEYRAVVRGGVLIGAAITRSRRVLRPLIRKEDDHLFAQLASLIRKQLVPSSPSLNFVADMFWPPTGTDRWLIEVNPLEGADTFGIDY